MALTPSLLRAYRYIGTTAASVLFDTVPAKFEKLKALSEARLGTIAAPLNALFANEKLSETIGTVGAETGLGNVEIRLDDDGVLPMPDHFRQHTTSGMVSYEACVLVVAARFLSSLRCVASLGISCTPSGS